VIATNICHTVCGAYVFSASLKPLRKWDLHTYSLKNSHPGYTGWLTGLLLIGFVCFQEMVQLCQERLTLDAMNHASFLNGFTAGRGAAQAVHADCKEQRCSVGSDI
jgi:hypothetical protein